MLSLTRRSGENAMPISDLPLLSMLRTRMHWHQARQQVLSENVANSDTPGYRPVDLVAPDFASKVATASPVSLSRTDPAHLAGVGLDDGPQFGKDRRGGYEIRPAGNAVNLEDEMIKVAGNQMDYQAATTLYTHSLSLIKTALGKS